VFLLREGEWSIHRSVEARNPAGASEGKRAVQVCTVVARAFVGDMELLLGDLLYTCTCVTKTPSVYYSLHYKDFLQIPSQVREHVPTQWVSTRVCGG
jgi:hypothetical protein